MVQETHAATFVMFGYMVAQTREDNQTSYVWAGVVQTCRADVVVVARYSLTKHASRSVRMISNGRYIVAVRAELQLTETLCE